MLRLRATSLPHPTTSTTSSRDSAQRRRRWKFCQKLLALCEARAKDDRNDVEARRDLSGSYERLGDVHLQMKQMDKARGYYQKVLDENLALARSAPNDVQVQRNSPSRTTSSATSTCCKCR